MSTTRAQRRPTRTLWVGWIAFAAVMIAMSGIFNLISGLTAIVSDEVYLSGPAGGVLVLDVTSWGWVHLVLGAGLLATGVATLMGQWWGRSAAVGLAALNMVSQLLLLPGYPVWSVLVIALDVLVIWAILVHGEEIEGM